MPKPFEFFYWPLLAICLSCQPASSDGTKKVVTTTNIIADICENLLAGADSITVESLMGPGVDPHLYKASQGDVAALSTADLIVYNGLHLEGKMTDIFENLRGKSRLALADSLPKESLINTSDFVGNYDPHVWFDPLLWELCVNALAQSLQVLSPRQSALIEANRQAYLKALHQVHQHNQESIERIPEKHRVLITAHDAFKYYGARYGIEVRGLQGISTTAEYGIQDVSQLVHFIVDRQIPAIFVESSVPKRSVEAVIQGAQARDFDLKLGGELYSDALGGAGSGADTYLKMLRKNTLTISTALQ